MSNEAAQQPPVVLEIKPDEILDAILVIGASNSVCESISDKSGKDACRRLIEPLEVGKADPVETFADMMINNPTGVDNIVDRLNDLIEKAGKRAEEKTKQQNGA